MIDKETYDSEARDVINTICAVIIDRYDFEVDTNHFYMNDGVSKVLVKNDLMIYFLWDFKEADIIWSFKEKENTSGHSIDYRYIYPENCLYHGVKSYRKYSSNEKPSVVWDRFIPKAIEKSYLDYLDKWMNEIPQLFETGNFELIRHFETRQQLTPESMSKEREMINKMNKGEE